ncbi:UNVERIFIED_CONTAM: hypothetical protein Sangu_0764100 [Sesamum angustifolium]|uniref:Bacterial surface antigen (D15) domain-containing protein n=1 Tax=Sesamum angustifolium TaxID=2727405 RepID=A0AAW2PSA9_9LAMI
MEAQPESDQESNQTESATSEPEDFEEFEEDDDDDDNEDDFGQEEREETESMTPETRMWKNRAKMESLIMRLSREQVPVRVHEVIIKGNTKTKGSLIESEVEAILRDATSFQQLLRAASVANARLQRLGVFDSVSITLDAGPPEVPGTANVVIEVSEAKNPVAGEMGIYTKPEEFDLRFAIPLGFYRAALNFGISGGLVFPWGSGYMNTPSYLPERFFMGGNSSPVCSLRGPTSVLGFRARGLGPAEPRRRDNSDGGKPDDSGMDHIGGDLALTAFADLSFDLPLRALREAGIHGHVFACTGSLNKLTEKAYKEFSFEKLRDSFRSSAGFGIIVPTKLFRMEVNYCYILKQNEHDQGKTGVQFSFSSPL